MTPTRATTGGRGGACVAPAAFLVALLATCSTLPCRGAAEEPARGETLPFHRVFVPAGRLDEVPLGDRRLVPVPLEEFDAAVAAAESATAPEALGEARYRVTVDGDGSLAGTLECDIGPERCPGEVRLGLLPVDRAVLSVDGATAEVGVHARDGLGLAASVARPGRYTFHFVLPSRGRDGAWVLPLVSAEHSVVALDLPAGVSPLVEGAARVRREGEADAADRGGSVPWRIDPGPLAEVRLSVVADRGGSPGIACWQGVTVALGESRLLARLVPSAPWRSRTVAVDADPRLVVEEVTAGGEEGDADAAAAADGDEVRTLRLLLPERAVGTVLPVEIRAAAPFAPAAATGEEGPAAPLPLLWPDPAAWAGGGVRIECAPGLALADVGIEGGIAVTESIAAAWPLPPAAAPTAETPPPTLHVEAQGPAPVVRLGVLPSIPELDVARVTTVEVTAAGVVGRAICDLRVRRGAAFEIGGRVAEGWFIDSVEAVERPGADERVPSGPTVPIEWRVVRDARGPVLRLGFPTAATPRRGLLLTVVGHRAGVDAEVPFACREMDMVRLDGEGDGEAVLALASSPETTIETPLPTPPPAAAPPRLSTLVSSTAIRAWIPSDAPALGGTAVLLERRAAVEGTTRVVLTARDDRLSESFTFSCRPGAAALDAMVVRFTVPTEDTLEWTLLPPAESSLAVRRLENAAGGGEGGESWLVEFQPPLRAEAAIRAARVVPLQGTVPVPLAWIEGSGREDGRVAVVNAGRRRPTIENHRLEELPPLAGTGEEASPKGTLAEFAYASISASGTPAAEIVTGGRDRDDDARAWAWREETVCWCHPSGLTEFETRFDVENHGRTRVAVRTPATTVPRGVAIDGVTVPSTTDGKTGALVVDLPTDRRFVRLTVRSEAAFPVGRGAWRVPFGATGIDMPVLERAWEVLVPDGVALVAATGELHEVAVRSPGWLERLLPVSVRRRTPDLPDPAAPRTRRGTIDAGFRARTFVQPVTGAAGGIVLVHARWLWGATLAVCLALAAFGVGVRRRMVRLGVAVALAIAALWIPAPFDGLARAGLWGLAAAALVRWVLGQWRAATRLAPLLLVIGVMAPPAAARQPEVDRAARPNLPAEGSWPVYVVPSGSAPGAPGDGADPGRGATVLVPEPLLEALARASGGRAARGVRVLATRLDTDPPEGTTWRLAVDVDAEPGSVLTLRQDGEAAFVAERATVDGLPARPATGSGPRSLRLSFAAPGRHRVEVPLDVAPVRAGDIAAVLVSLPAAPRGVVVVAGGTERGAPSAVQVELPDPQGRPRRVDPGPRAWGTTSYETGGAERVRIVWAADGRTPLADVVPAVESRNTLSWRDGDCRLAAVYRIDGANQIVRGVVVDADPRFGPPSVADPSLAVTPLGGGRHLVVPLAPRRGKWGFEATFGLPLADPVGSFDIPGAWIESAVADSRGVEIVAAEELAVRVTLPDDAVPAPPRPDAAGVAAAWRVEATRAARPADAEGGYAAMVKHSGGSGPGRMVVERRRSAPRGSQQVNLDFAPDRVRVRLRARIDATAAALVTVPITIPAAADVERAVLREEQSSDGAEGDPLDVRWHRSGPDRILAVLQRPRTGTFALDLLVAVDGPPPARGTLPLVRATFEQGGAATVTWSVTEGQRLRLDGADAAASRDALPAASATGSIDLAADAAPPGYELLAAPDDAAEERGDGPDAGPPDPVVTDAPTPPGETPPRVDPRVELAEHHVALDARGRAWGVTRFELVAAEALVRLRLPEGMRLFEVFVDDRAGTDAVPARDGGAAGGDVRELRLLDAGRPRSIVVGYAGDLPGGSPPGGRCSIEAPALMGIPCRRTAWVVDLPERVTARPLAPARIVDARALAAERSAAVARLEPVFEAAMERASAADARRLGEFLAERRRTAAAPVATVWDRTASGALLPDAARSGPLHLLEPAAPAEGDGGPRTLGLVLGRRPESSLAGRVWATLVMVAGMVALVEARRRTPLVSRVASAIVANPWFGPVAAVLVGGGWLGILDPAWPGWLLLAGGVVALAVRAVRLLRRRAPGSLLVEGVTVAARGPRGGRASTVAPPRGEGEVTPTGSTIRRGR